MCENSHVERLTYDTLEIPLLLDFYEVLLTEKTARVLHLHFNEDLTLSEIADLSGTSRQSVYDTVKRGTAGLEEFEAKLGLLKRHTRIMDLLKALEAAAEGACVEKIKECIQLLRELI